MLEGLQNFHFYLCEGPATLSRKTCNVDCGGLLSGGFTQPPSGRTHRHRNAQQEGILIRFYLLILHTVHFEDDKLLQALYNKEKTIKFSFFQFPLS